MKHCPKCGRSFADDNQKFCTIDGGLLTDKPFDPNATIAAPAAPLAPEPPNTPLPDFSETIATSSSAPTVVLPKNTGPTGSATAANIHQQQQPVTPPPQVSAAPPPPSPSPSPVAPTAPAAPASAVPAKKKSKLPLVLGILAVLLLLGIGGVVAAFFLVIKPRLQQLNSDRPIVVRETQTPAAGTPEVSTPSPEAKPTEPEFVPPADTTKFTNSSASLDGSLAEHYFDFSFYYPNTWLADPKAGVAGSGNFVKVERRLPPDFTQENFAVRWYESKGTYDADLPDFPKLVEQYNAGLAKAFPGYHKVSEGPTKINSLEAYELKWEGLSKGTEKGDLHLWGRVVFVPKGIAGNVNGAVLTMFTTSLAGELSSVEDVGTRGEMPVILESFRFGGANP
jgi:hypothetical protein